MPAPAWLSYVGAITGIVGAFTGIAGAVISYVNYRRISRIKALDLRLELRKLESDAGAALEQLPGLLEEATQSRIAIRNAQGTLMSGAMDAWKALMREDQDAIQYLRARIPVAEDPYRSFTHEQLEAKLVEMHALRRRADELMQRYRAGIAADDKDRDFIRANAGVRFRQ